MRPPLMSPAPFVPPRGDLEGYELLDILGTTSAQWLAPAARWHCFRRRFWHPVLFERSWPARSISDLEAADLPSPGPGGLRHWLTDRTLGKS